MFRNLTCQGFIHNRFLLSLIVVGYIFIRPIAQWGLRNNEGAKPETLISFRAIALTAEVVP
jgi:hypothetical protein